MKVILTRDVSLVGKQGDVVTVADGYARNYLLRRNLAVKADKGALKALDQKIALEQHKGEKHLTSARDVAERLHNSRIVIEGRAARGSTKLYGAITHQDIADAIESQLKMEVDRRRIMLEGPIKSLGTYRVPIRLHSQVAADVRLVVIGEGEEAPPMDIEPAADIPAEMAAEPKVEAIAEPAVEATEAVAEPIVEEAAESVTAESEIAESVEMSDVPIEESEPAETLEPPAEEERSDEGE